MLKKETTKKFHHYLQNHSLSEALSFGENKVLSFHWANDRLSSDYIKDFTQEKKNSSQDRVENLQKDLDKLREIPIWLMSRRGQIKSDLYNLYQCYLDPRLRMQWFDMEEILVSLNHEAGPFASVKAMRWLDKKVYAKFIYLKMIYSWVPQRSFRLSLDIPVEIRVGRSPLNSIQGKIHQVSEHGIVLHLNSCSHIKEWGNEEIIFLKKELNLKEERGIEKCLRSEEWVNGLENFTMKGDDLKAIVLKSLETQGDKDNFIFIPFDKVTMLSIRSHSHCLKNLNELFNETKDTIHKYIEAA